MRVSPNGNSEYHNGNEVGRYGRDIGAGEYYFIQYHDGIRGKDVPAWAMDVEVLSKVSISVSTILVADANNGLYAIGRDEFEDSVVEMDGREQHYADINCEFVHKVADDPEDVLQGHLWITPENAHGGYHKDKNEA